MCGRIPGLCGGRGKNNSGNSQLSQSISCQSIMHRSVHSSLLPSKFWGDFFTPPPPPPNGLDPRAGRVGRLIPILTAGTVHGAMWIIDCVPRYWSDVYIASRIDHLPRVLPARARPTDIHDMIIRAPVPDLSTKAPSSGSNRTVAGWFTRETVMSAERMRSDGDGSPRMRRLQLTPVAAGKWKSANSRNAHLLCKT